MRNRNYFILIAYRINFRQKYKYVKVCIVETDRFGFFTVNPHFSRFEDIDESIRLYRIRDRRSE